MKCPACQSELVEVDLGKLKVDICQKGCGGVWLDRFELNKTNSCDSTSIKTMLSNLPEAKCEIPDKQRLCPRDSTIMMQHFYSVKKQVKVDHCPQCAGTWLDRGELDTIQNQYKNACEKEKDADAYLEKEFKRLLSSHQ